MTEVKVGRDVSEGPKQEESDEKQGKTVKQIDLEKVVLKVNSGEDELSAGNFLRVLKGVRLAV